MAKTQRDYEYDGEQIFKAGNERPSGNSWQAKAMQCGYDCAQTDSFDEAEDAKAEELEMHNDAMKAVNSRLTEAFAKGNESINKLREALKKFDPPHSARDSHLIALKRMFKDETNPKRKERLRLKCYEISGIINTKGY